MDKMTLKMLLRILQLWIVLCPSANADDSNVNGNITSLIRLYEDVYCGSRCFNASSPSIFEDITESTPATNTSHPGTPGPSAPPGSFLPDLSCSTCFCDSECRSFGDCCSHHYIGNGDHAFQCQAIDSGTQGFMTLFMVANCAPGDENYSKKLSRKCNTPNRLNHHEEVLVSINRENQTSLTFRNKYCAQCHGYEDFQAWTVDVSCMDLPEEINDISDPAIVFTKLQSSSMCTVGQNKPNGISTRPCTELDLVSECNVTGIWQEYDSDIEAACHSYTHVFREYYKNVFCFICNENEILPEMPNNDPIGVFGRGIFVSFAAILQFEEESVGMTTPGECPKGEYDDIFTDNRRMDKMTLKMLLRILQLWIVLCPSANADDSNVNGNITSLIRLYEDVYCGSRCFNASSPSIFEDITESTPATNTSHPGTPGPSAPPGSFLPDLSCSTCFCDSECRSFGDCCSHHYIGNGDHAFQCQAIDSGTQGFMTLFMVANCAPGDENYSKKLSRKCNTPNRLNHHEEVLVSINRENQTSLTFRNKYCAQCHGYEDFQAWTVDVSCMDLPEEINDISDPAIVFTKLQSSSMCTVGQNKPNGISTRPCTELDLVSECNVTGIWQEYDSDIEAACHSYTHVFREYYKNVFCFICNENEILPEMPNNDPIGVFGRGIFVSFAAILQFEEESVGMTTPGECPKGEYDDIFTNRCLPILCPSFYQLHQKECTPGMFDSNMTLYYVVKVHLMPTPTDHLHLGKGSMGLLPEVILDYYKQRGVQDSWHVEKTIVSVYRENSSFGTMDTHGGNDTVASDDHRHENVSHSDQYVISRIDVDLYVSYSRGDYAEFFESLSNLLFERFSISVEGTDITFRAVYKSMLPQVHYVKSHPEFVIQNDFSYLVIFRPFSSNYVKRNCAQVKYFKSDYSLLSNNSVLLKENNILISEENFTITEVLDIMVCISTVEHLKIRYEELRKERLSSTEHGHDVLTILTAVCLVFSMFFLFLSFLVYALLPELRTLPGCNMMFLISSLFLAQGLFLFGAGAVSHHVICKIFGVLIHYFWMATFAWMNVCTFHVFRVFRNILSSVKLSSDKTIILLKYGFFSYSVPAGIVAVTILANYFLSGMSTIGYGDSRTTCFLNPGVITLVAFGIPAVATVVCTGAFFVGTVVALRRASTNRASVGKKETKVILNLVKLSSATGLSWVFGLLGSLFSIEAFLYVFVVLAAGQGVLIFMSFVSNKRVFKLVLGRCCPIQRGKRDRTSSYTISGTTHASSDSNDTLM